VKRNQAILPEGYQSKGLTPGKTKPVDGPICARLRWGTQHRTESDEVILCGLKWTVGAQPHPAFHLVDWEVDFPVPRNNWFAIYVP